MTISRSDIPHCLRYTSAASSGAAFTPAWSPVETCPPPTSRTGAPELALAACLSGFGPYRSIARISPIHSPANAAIVASVSPRCCIRATAKPASAPQLARLLLASARTRSRATASRSDSHTSTSVNLLTATMSVAASSTSARSRCARASLARACASRTCRRASTFEVFPAMSRTISRDRGAGPPPQPHSFHHEFSPPSSTVCSPQPPPLLMPLCHTLYPHPLFRPAAPLSSPSRHHTPLAFRRCFLRVV